MLEFEFSRGSIDAEFMRRTDERLLVTQQKPELSLFETPEINAQTPAHLLDSDITPLEALFVRNTGRLPVIADAAVAAWTLAVDGAVLTPKTWMLRQLQHDFEQVTQTAVIECAGNGRAFFTHETSAPPWTHGAVGCVTWTGVRVADLLAACGLKADAVYTGHHSPDRAIDGSGPAISRGLPIAKAMAPETLIAYAVNGVPLPHLHGGPLRVVAPGFPGSAWQKWLNRISVRDREHDGERMTGLHYRLPRRPLRPGDPIDLKQFDVITDMPVRSVITFPRDGFAISAANPLSIRGHAWSGHIPVASVDISIDGGKSWRPAELRPARERFAWRRFELRLPRAAPGHRDIVARATDVQGNSQPLDSVSWNPRGYCNNAAHRISGTLT
jgi:sulfite oxidase